MTLKNFDMTQEEKPQSIEIPFGAFDSEFVRDEYLIPEGCEARIEGNKVIIEKKEGELTEFEKQLGVYIYFQKLSCEFDKDEKYYIRDAARVLLDLARKEIQPEIDEKLKEEYDRGYSIGKFDAGEAKVKELVAEFEKGRQNALKSLPKWKKATEHLRGEGFIHYSSHSRMAAEYAYTNVEGGEYYLNIEDLKTLPKEE